MVVGVLQGLRNARERAMYSNIQGGLQRGLGDLKEGTWGGAAPPPNPPRSSCGDNTAAMASGGLKRTKRK